MCEGSLYPAAELHICFSGCLALIMTLMTVEEHQMFFFVLTCI